MASRRMDESLQGKVAIHTLSRNLRATFRQPRIGSTSRGLIITQVATVMKLRVLFFASVREAVGKREEDLELQDEVCTLATVRRALCARYPVAATTIQAITLAKNLEYAEDTTPVQDGDEVALIPPISGG